MLGRSSLLKASGASEIAPGVPWTPANISTFLWFDASDASTITLTSGAVSQWNDKSERNKHLTQTVVSTARPVVSAAALNGLNTITYDGVNDYMDNPSVGSSGIQSFFMIAVFRMNTGGNNEDLPMGIGATGANRQCRCFYRANAGTNVGFAGFSADIASSAYSYDIGGSYHIFEIGNTQLTGPNQVEIGRDGQATSYTPSNSLLAATDGFTMGSLRGGAIGNYYSAISVAEFICLHYFPTTDQRQRLRGSLAWKWGLQGNLPADHPYKFSRPTV